MDYLDHLDNQDHCLSPQYDAQNLPSTAPTQGTEKNMPGHADRMTPTRKHDLGRADRIGLPWTCLP